jgi:hypothetical protein
MRGAARRIPIGTFAALLLVGGVASAQSPLKPVDVAGEWEGVLALEGGSHPLNFTFRIADSTLAGTVYADGQKWGEMERITVKGDTVHFTLANVEQFDFTCVIKGRNLNLAMIMWNGSTRNFALRKKINLPDPGSGPQAAG